MNRLAIISLLALLAIPLNGSSVSAQSCSANPVAVQVLVPAVPESTLLGRQRVIFFG